VALCEVVVLLIFARTSCRNEAEAPLPRGVDYTEKLAFNHADDKIAFFAIVLAIIKNLDQEWVTESSLCHLERDAVLTVIVASHSKSSSGGMLESLEFAPSLAEPISNQPTEGWGAEHLQIQPRALLPHHVSAYFCVCLK
jgi:hypothetical protein